MNPLMDGRRAAVLVPLFVDDRGEHGLILIQRAGGTAEHAGQVSFPGGRHDPARDESLLATALREAHEEIGLEGEGVRFLGALPERRTFTSGRLVSPFVALVPAKVLLRPEPREVEAIFTVRLDDFLPADRRDRLLWEHGGQAWQVPCVRVGEHLIWGLTLDVVDDLIAAIERLLPP